MDFIDEFEDVIKAGVNGNIDGTLLNADKDFIYEFAETLNLVIRYYFRYDGKPNENFSFIANSSLSGGSFPCAASECRLNKLDQLASFSSLYSDEVYIQNPFEEIVLRGRGGINLTARHEIISGIYNYIYLKPLIKRGIIKYAQNMVSLCNNHRINLAEPIAKKIQQKEDKLYNLLHDFLLDTCEVTLSLTHDKKPFFEIKSSTEFIDHGVSYFHLMEPFGDYIDHLCTKEMPYVFTKNEIKNEHILRLIITPLIKDLSDQEWHSAFYGTSYLCDNQIQMDIASKLNNPVYKANSTSFNQALKHYLPSIKSRNLEYILDLRNREEEAFNVYRDKINTMFRKSADWNQKDISDAFRDQILPEIHIIEKKVKDWKEKTRGGIKDKLIIGTGTVSFGLYSGILPHDISHLLAAVGGGAAVVSTLIDYSKTLKGKNEARSNDFYFLWQAKK